MSEDSKTTIMMGAMSGAARRARRWEKANLITPEQTKAIIAFERERQGKRFLRGLMAVALFAIGTGVLSIVAANWVHMSGAVKIGAHFLLNAAAAVTMWKAARDNNKWWREGATLLFLILNLTMIALIGQVFQLGGSWGHALALWMLVSSPAVFIYGESFINALPWTVGALGTIAFNLGDILKHLSDLNAFLVALAVSLFTPLILMAGGLNGKLASTRPQWSVVFFRLGALILAADATFASFWWYTDVSRHLHETLAKAGSFGTGYVEMLAVCISAPLAATAWFRLNHMRGKIDRTGLTFVIGSLVSYILPMVLMGGEHHFIGAIHFIIYWAFLGVVSYRLGYEQLVSYAISLITLRIIIVYIELFGGLFTTGVGLIAGGVLLLLTLRAARYLKETLKQMSVDGGEHVF